MKIVLSFTCLFFIIEIAFCQVAINTDGAAISDPKAMLEIKKPDFSKVRIRTLHYNDTAQLELSNRTSANVGTDFRLTAKREQGLFFSSVSDLSANNHDSLFTILTNGRIGIGKKNPSYKLDVNGDVNLNSYLRVNGSAGTNGQVLTSTGTGAPAWKTSAYGDNIRFGLRFNGTSSPVSISNLYYNLSPTDVGITPGTTSITISQSGLYHFEGVYSGTVQGTGFSGPPEFTLSLNLTGSSTYGINLCTWKQLVYRTAVINNWYQQENFSIDMYVTAPAQLLVYRSFLASTTPSHTEASVTMYGYLISQ